MTKDNIEISWSDCIVLFNTLIRSIEGLRNEIESGSLDEDEQYDLEEELNDCVMLLSRLQTKYGECPDKGEMSLELKKKIQSVV
ncbi:MAG: hypothetical protein K0U59_09535 [Gammaproteobacteria bacterium]|nr:hypothetical protein [Gammaproteobacteria bacterium]